MPCSQSKGLLRALRSKDHLKNFGSVEVQTRGRWVRSANATSVVCSPPPGTNKSIIHYFKCYLTKLAQFYAGKQNEFELFVVLNVLGFVLVKKALNTGLKPVMLKYVSSLVTTEPIFQLYPFERDNHVIFSAKMYLKLM